MLKAKIDELRPVPPFLAWINPFGDGNGRKARLLEFYFLMGARACLPSAE